MFNTSIVLVIALSITVGLVWLFDPIIQQIDKSKIDVLDPTQYNTYYLGDTQRQVDLSVVFPAYNEEDRIITTIESTIPFLQDFSQRKGFQYELIVVDDGSTDSTVKVVQKYQVSHPDIVKIFSLKKNQGKGGAMKLGITLARGRFILMADADGATEISDLERLFNTLEEIPEDAFTHEQKSYHKKENEVLPKMVVGSRAHLAEKSIAQRAFYRTILMKGFHFLVTLLATKNIQDTQCGFKLFTNSAARDIFSDLHLYRWAFDIEVIYRAEAMEIPIREIPVNWREVDGSKLIKSKIDVITTSLTMARDMFCVRFAYLFGIWSLPVSTHRRKHEEM